MKGLAVGDEQLAVIPDEVVARTGDHDALVQHPELELPEVLDMPFAPQRPSWTFADGTRAWRPRELPSAAERLPDDGPPTRKNGTRLEPPGKSEA